MNRFRGPWWAVLAGVLGLSVNAGVINVFVFGVFMTAVAQSLGMSRGFVSSGVLTASVSSALLLPAIGMLIDRWGPRRVLLSGIPLYALALGLLGLLQANARILFSLQFALCGVFGGMTAVVPYAALVSGRFDRRRGLALGIVMAGIGLGVACLPPLAEFYIRSFGWRAAYGGLAATMFVLAWVPVALFGHENHAAAAGRRRSAAARPPGAALVEALRSWRFWALGASFLLAAAAINAVLVHLVPMLGDRGVRAEAAVAALSLAGIAMIVGRILAGWLVDRLHGPFVSIALFAAALAGVALLAAGRSGLAADAGAALCGLGLGAAAGQHAFLVTRYFGLRDYGKIFSLQFGLFLIGNGGGPAVAGALYDHSHSYALAFVLAEAALLLACLLLAPLGAYAFAPPARAVPHAAGEAKPAVSGA